MRAGRTCLLCGARCPMAMQQGQVTHNGTLRNTRLLYDSDGGADRAQRRVPVADVLPCWLCLALVLAKAFVGVLAQLRKLAS